MFILDFLCIHPFNDGNGRMSRLLTLLLFYKAGYIVGKYVSMEMLIEKTKKTYYEALQASSVGWHEGENSYEPFVKYYLGVMLKAYNEGFEKYKIEDGNFRIKKKITKSQRENIEKNGVTLYENFYLEEALDNGSTMRIFKNREKINLVCLMEGKLPEKAGEMAIDRMYADNNKISVGDTL